MRKLTPEERSDRHRKMWEQLKADPVWMARRTANCSAAQKARFAKPKGRADLAKMQAARWAKYPQLTADQIRLAKKMQSGGLRNARHQVRQMLAAEQEQRT